MSNYKRIPLEELIKGEIYLGYHKYENDLYYLKYLGESELLKHLWSIGSYTATRIFQESPYSGNTNNITPIKRIPKEYLDIVPKANTIFYEEFGHHLPPELLYDNFRVINGKKTPVVS